MSLSYVHRYHSGSFADIHKHLALIAVLEALTQKNKPFTVLDAFAGEGRYDLNSVEGQKNKEYKTGYSFILGAKNTPKLVQKLLSIINKLPAHHYPGSPLIIEHFLSENDSAHLIERHPAAFMMLKQHFGKSPKLHLHERDAFEAMNALVPFKSKRGLIFIDPSYELKAEYEEIGLLLHRLYAKFSNGIFLIWYPLLYNMDYHVKLLNVIKKSAIKNIWCSEWVPFKKEFAQQGMYGSGVVIINPPWGVDKLMIDTLNELKQTVYPLSNIREPHV